MVCYNLNIWILLYIFSISFAQCSLIVLASPWLINKSTRANQVGPEILAY